MNLSILFFLLPIEKRKGEIHDGDLNPCSELEQKEFYRSFMNNIDKLISFDKSWEDLDVDTFDGSNITTQYIR